MSTFFNSYNPLTDVDAYKVSHFSQYPKDADGYFGYIEARGGIFDKTVFFGEQTFRKNYLNTPFTMEHIEEAADICEQINMKFNVEGAKYILDNYGGYAPITVKCLPEGTIVPTGVPLLTVECEDKKAFWYASYLETKLLRSIWYPTTVATLSHAIKEIILNNMIETCDNLDKLPYMLHDFGARGSSSYESSLLAGAAHLINFKGTDTVAAVPFIKKIYHTRKDVGFTIPASEHSTITSWGQENELEAYRNMLNTYKSNGIFACVSDSYDIYNAVENLWGNHLKQDIINSGTTVVIRPDSGDPKTVIGKLLDILESKFGVTLNSKGYKVLNHVRLIQGDGVNINSIQEILDLMKLKKFSADNIAFGMGGALHQKVNRDTLGFAMKCSAIQRNGVWREVFKNPVDMPQKASKKGKLTTITNGTEFKTHTYPEAIPNGWRIALVPSYINGKNVQRDTTFDEIKERANKDFNL